MVDEPVVVTGVDPGSKVLGLSKVCGCSIDEKPKLLHLQALRLSSDSKNADLKAQRKREALDATFSLTGGVDLVACEARPPKLTKGSKPSHTSGSGPARWRGISELSAHLHGVPYREAPIGSDHQSGWRPDMVTLHGRWGGGYLAHEQGRAQRSLAKCGIRRVSVCAVNPNARTLKRSCGTIHNVLTSLLKPGAEPPTCPTCSVRNRRRAASMKTGDIWKSRACVFVRTHWPEQYAVLVEDARSRAQDKDKADHELIGVADACEAVGVACWGLWRALG